jgi:hypothetical protein
MSITEEFSFDKDGEVVRFAWFRPYFLTIAIALVAVLSFGIGRLTSENKGGVSINYEPESLPQTAPVASVVQAGGSVTASSQGTRYYYANCRNTISEKNKVSFATALMAEKAGYTLAANCKRP